MSRLAVIDIGTNSVKLTVADDSTAGMNIVDEASTVTRLGEGVDQTKVLAAAAMTRTLSAVEAFVRRAQDLGAERIAAIGSSALRDAGNGAEFQDQVKTATGIALEIIAGTREAELGYRSVLADNTLHLNPDQPVLVFDIGGGSTELICGRSGRLQEHASLDIGAVRLTERHLKSDPPTDEEYGRALGNAAEEIRSFRACRSGAVQVVGIGGTAVNVASMAAAAQDVAMGSAVESDQLNDMIDRLRRCSLEQRRQIKGLEPARADIIIGGIAILQTILTEFGGAGYQPSVRGMRFGLLAELAGS